MRKALLALVVIASFGPSTAAIAAGPPITIPKDCHEWNQLLGIDNVRSCDGS
jgi:hypothetical protein